MGNTMVDKASTYKQENTPVRSGLNGISLMDNTMWFFNLQYLGEDGEAIGDVGEYFGDDGENCAGAAEESGEVVEREKPNSHVGEYRGEVGLNEGLVGEYLGDVGLNDGD